MPSESETTADDVVMARIVASRIAGNKAAVGKLGPMSAYTLRGGQSQYVSEKPSSVSLYELPTDFIPHELRATAERIGDQWEKRTMRAAADLIERQAERIREMETVNAKSLIPKPQQQRRFPTS